MNKSFTHIMQIKKCWEFARQMISWIDAKRLRWYKLTIGVWFSIALCTHMTRHVQFMERGL